MHQLRCDWIHMPDIREQETQTRIYIHISSPGVGFTLYASEIMVGSSSKLSRIKTHRTNITSIDFYLGLFLTIFHKSILLRNPLCPLNIAKNVPIESFWHALFPILTIHTHVPKDAPSGNQDANLDGHTGCCFCKMTVFHQPNSNKLLKSSGMYQQLVMSSVLSSYFRSSLCSHIKTLGRLGFAATGELQTLASKVYIWKHLGSTPPTPPQTGKEKSGFIVFKWKR